MQNEAIFLDRDGTINKEYPYISSVDQIKIPRPSIKGLSLLKSLGFKLFIVTNQSGVARGYFTLEKLHEIHEHLQKTLTQKGISLDEILFCPHHPDEKCTCRKPNGALIEKVQEKYQLNIRRSYMIGDNTCDVELGQKMGLKTILVLTGLGKKTIKVLQQEPDYVATHLFDAAQWIKKNHQIGSRDKI